MSLFWYKRKIKEKKDDKDVTTVYWDCFNTECVVRGIWFSDKVFAVLLNDGHEQATDQQVPVKNKNNGTTLEVQRRRDWHYSQIELDVEDANRLWRGQLHPSKESEAPVLD